MLISFMVTATSTITVPDDLLPPVKLGNLKDPDKISQKISEHREKCLKDIESDPLFTYATEIRVLAWGEDPTPTEFTGSPFDFEVEQAYLLTGPHPTTHARLCMSAFLREGKPLPNWLNNRVHRINPWLTAFPEACKDREPEQIATILGLESDILGASGLLLKKMGLPQDVLKSIQMG